MLADIGSAIPPQPLDSYRCELLGGTVSGNICTVNSYSGHIAITIEPGWTLILIGDNSFTNTIQNEGTLVIRGVLQNAGIYNLVTGTIRLECVGNTLSTINEYNIVIQDGTIIEDTCTSVPEFPTMAIPVISVVGIVAYLSYRKK